MEHTAATVRRALEEEGKTGVGCRSGSEAPLGAFRLGDQRRRVEVPPGVDEDMAQSCQWQTTRIEQCSARQDLAETAVGVKLPFHPFIAFIHLTGMWMVVAVAGRETGRFQAVRLQARRSELKRNEQQEEDGKPTVHGRRF